MCVSACGGRWALSSTAGEAGREVAAHCMRQRAAGRLSKMFESCGCVSVCTSPTVSFVSDEAGRLYFCGLHGVLSHFLLIHALPLVLLTVSEPVVSQFVLQHQAKL